jgi:cobyrinic acid a,c-diamide synthase
VASGQNPCYNLDPFLIGEENILPSFVHRQKGFDISLIEGNRGIFDGMDLEGSQSTARLAEALKSPVILIMDCTKMTRTAAALVMGVKKFDPRLKLAGVVLNLVAGKRHEAILRGSIERYAKVPVIGAIPRVRAGELSERHMGLVPFQEHPEVEGAIASARELIKKSVDLDSILKIARSAPPLRQIRTRSSVSEKSEGIKVGVIRDRAFQFYYPENIEALHELGAEVVELSSLFEAALPDVDALYIGGGFPETHAITLSKNRAFLTDLRSRVDAGLPVYAECGGLMYLGENLLLKGEKYKMAGIFPYDFSLEDKPVAHGYSIAKVSAKNPFYRKGTVLKGHEFHYSRPVRDARKKTSFSLRVLRGTGIEKGMDGLVYKNVFATYTHTHSVGTPEWAPGILRAAREFRKRK